MMGAAGSFTTDVDAARIPLDASPIDPALARQAMLHLMSAHAVAHGRLPSAQAVADVWRMLAGTPRSEIIPAAVLRARGLDDDRERVSGVGRVNRCPHGDAA